MTDYTWSELIQGLKDLAAMRRDTDIWVVPQNPNLSGEERLRLAMLIEYLSGWEEEQVKEDKDED